MKFAFIIMGEFESDRDHAEIHGGAARIIGVKNLDEAADVARRLKNEGVDCIELCGAFSQSGARKIIEATGNEIPVGYVTHLPEQDDVYKAVFGE